MMTRYLASKIALARLAIVWERFWQCGWRTAAVIAAVLAFFATGLIDQAPDWMRWMIVAAFAGALLWALASFRHFLWPGRADAVRRVEQASGLAHRPASGVADRLAKEDGEAEQNEVWQAHRERLLAQLKSLKAGVPRPSLAGRDPYALRFVAVLALIAGLVWSQGQISGPLTRALAGAAPAAEQIAVTADAWIRPPAYTGKPPVLLTSQAMREAQARGEPIRVPENSLLTVRITGASEPKLTLSTSNDPVPLRRAEQTASAEVKLAADAVAVLSDGARQVERWPIAIIPDQPPKVKFTADPRAEPLGALTVEWQAEDDYGVSRITAEIQLSDIQNGEVGLSGNGFFLFDPPAFPVNLKQAAPKSATGKSVNDLTAHPWAGLAVDMTLTVRDAAGKAGTSEFMSFTLPERPFDQPLARALVEQRKALVAEPDDTAKVQIMLAALMAYPQGMVDESGVAIGISAVASRLRNSQGHDDVKQAIAMLWTIALAIEEGDLSGARAELEAIRKALEQALREGAPPERIAELTEKLRDAMNKYMREMAEEARKRAERGEKPQRSSPNSRTITQQDLQKMLDRIEELSKNGANDAAREMLSQLDELLRNLQPGMRAEPGQQQGGPLSEMLDELSELMRRQQRLMDDTGRLPNQPGEGMNGDQPEGNEPGQRGGRQAQGGEGLADQQRALERMLEELQRRMGQQGLAPPQSFGDAGKSMNGATGKLRDGKGRDALGDQSDALEALREGARGMAKQLSEQRGQGQAGNPGDHGEARGDNDPLGRPNATRGEDAGPDRDMLPGEIAQRRAREILEMLRGRANNPDRPRIERDYLERLLRGLF